MIDNLGDRMKIYEGAETKRRFLRGMPIVARLDGRSFHNFTKGLPRPFCIEMHQCMVAATKSLIEETSAIIGYTQSDEITLVWTQNDQYLDGIWFNGNIHKMTSVLASIATVHFYRAVLNHLPEYADKCPTFDCRVWQVANNTEAANAILWREQDATKNSVQMAASAVFSHQELHGIHTGQMKEMLLSRDIDWEKYPLWFKQGSYFKRARFVHKYTYDELQELPEKHHARLDPDCVYVRSVVEEFNPYAKMDHWKQNREEVLFGESDTIKDYEGREWIIYQKPNA